MKNTVELLAPAGNPEKLEIAVHYGADAVYLAGKDFSLRNFSGNFTHTEMGKGIQYAHKHGVKVYVACNVYPRNHEFDGLKDYIRSVAAMKPDGLIVADPGIFVLTKKIAPDLDIHVSTQANTTSWAAARFWKDMGATRINTARELPLEQIREIVKKGNIEVECFVHGAMCISYSGRCLLSSFLTNRDSNRGQCSHPCRWKYRVEEAKRPGEYFPLSEDDKGAYIFNSRDLCMIDHIPELIRAGISALKIEGRMKGINYLGSVVKTYRDAIDAWYKNPENYTVKPEWKEELSRINNRYYTTGFYFGYQGETTPNYTDAHPKTIHRFVGKILDQKNTDATIEIRNKICVGDAVEILTTRGPAIHDTIASIADMRGTPLDVAQPNTTAVVSLTGRYAPDDLVRITQESTYGKGQR